MKRTTAAHSVGGQHVDKVLGVTIGTTGIAEDRNNLQEEIAAVIEGVGVTLDGTDWMQMEKALIAQSRTVGEIVDTVIEQTPVAWGAARNQTNPGDPRYNPLLAIWDADHDIAAANYPLLVPGLRGMKAKASNGAGGYVTDHSVTVAAHVVTGSGTAWDNLLASLADDQLVDVGMGKGAFTAWRCLNVGGTDYAITGVSTAAHTVTIVGDSLAGAQTAIWYPHRISGSTTTARTFHDSGRATVSAGTAECIGGARRRDRLQGHKHAWSGSGAAGSGVYVTQSNSSASGSQSNDIAAPTTDGTNGAPRTGATTDPRANVVFRHIFCGVLL